MGTVNASAEATVNAPADKVYGLIRDFREHHPNFLPEAFSDFKVVEGGVGAGTVVTYTFTAGRRTRQYRMTVAEPTPGKVLTETDANSTLVTTFTVTPSGSDASTVRIHTSWEGAGGIGGIFEGFFAPKALKSVYTDELRRLDEYAQKQA